jgi:hypothetical protein
MKSKAYKSGLSGIYFPIAGTAVFIAVLLILLRGFSAAQKNAEEEGRKIAEDSKRRAAAACYALEGVYPESFEYIREHYGVYVDEEKYKVFYEIFASNIMPDITVIARTG